MENSIKFKNTNESFIEFLKTQKMIDNEIYQIKKNELKKFFDFESEDEIINVSLYDDNNAFLCSFLDEEFIFFKEIKKVFFQDANGNEKIIEFQLSSEESQFFKNIFKNKYDFEIYVKNKDNKWEIINIDSFNIIDVNINNCKIIQKKKIELNNIKFTSFYPYFIIMTNPKVYQNFSFKETPIRNKLFKDLDKFLFFEPQNFLGICGPSGSGKTTSILYYIHKKRIFFNMIYINCFTILRKDLDNEIIKKILNYEFENSVNKRKQKNIINNFKLSLEALLKKDINRENDFIFKLINDIIKNYNNENSNKKLSIFIDQYSSKYDKDNIQIFSLIDKLGDYNNRCSIILISSMNNTCVKNNMKLSLIKDNNYLFIKHILYTFYGELFEINDIMDKETNNELKHIMNEEFGNSALIYYKLKSKILEIEQNDKDDLINNIFIQLIDEEKKDIIKEIQIFYNIIYSNNLLDNIKNIILNVVDIINFIKEKRAYNFRDIPELFEKLPFKFFKISYNEIEISHPEFIKLLPKEIRKKIIKLSREPNSQNENVKCKLKERLVISLFEFFLSLMNYCFSSIFSCDYCLFCFCTTCLSFNF
jgi:hypothetical protein